MPVRNEEAFIERAISSVLVAGRELADFEVLVVDGMSDDGTRAIVERLAGEHPVVRLLDNPLRTVPHAMNVGVAAARGEVVVRVDGHAEVAPDFLRASLDELARHPECACVGGVIENVNLSPISAAISTAMSSRFGVGNAIFRTGGEVGYVDTLAFGAYRRADLERIGGFDEELVRNQDDELNFRLLRSGRKIWLSDKIRSRYYVRSSLDRLFRQYHQYGYWKVYVNRKHGTVTNLRQLVPPVFVASLALLGVGSLVLRSARILLVLEVGVYVIAALSIAARTTRSPSQVLRIVASFAALHVAYGLGYLAGVRDFFILGRRPSVASAESSR